MSPVGAFAQWMGRWSVSPSVESAFTVTNKEGPMAILPLELSTTVGRSVSSARRNGFLEFQERFLEEIAVAIVWLYGVNFMSNLFNKRIKPGLFKGSGHLNPETAWDWGLFNKNRKSVDLLPSERFTRHAADRASLTKIKTIGAFISVVLATATAALLIPWLNKKKTEAIVSYLNNKESRQQEALNTRSVAKGLPPGLSYSQWGAMPELSKSFPVKAFGAQPDSHAESLSPGLKFGFSGGDLVQQVGHAIQQTDYGSLLAVDGGLAAGRIKVYGDRSPYEGAEIALRDIGSIYFYMYSTPHIMRLMAKLMNPAFNTDVLLEPKVGRSLQQNVLQQLLLKNPERKAKLPPSLVQLLKGNDPRALEEALEKSEVQAVLKQMPVSSAELERAVQGAVATLPKQIQAELVRSWTTAGHSQFLSLFEKEAKIYGVSDASPAVTNFVKQQGLTTDSLAQLLKQVKQGEGTFQTLDRAQRQNLEVAIKQAFRYSAGRTFEMSSLKNQSALRQMAQQLPANEREKFWERAQVMARQDARDQANSLFRRNLNLGLTPVQKMLSDKSQPFMELGESMADWVEKANARHQSLGEVSQAAIGDLVEDLRYYQSKSAFKALPNGEGDIPGLLTRLEHAAPNEIPDLLLKLSTQLEGFKPNLWQRVKGSYMDKSDVMEQLDALKALLAPETHSGSVDALKSHLPTSAKTLDELASHNINAYSNTLTALAKKANADATVISLMEHSQKPLLPLLTGKQGRLFSLYTAEANNLIDEKYRSLLVGGIQNDSRLLNESLETAGRLKLHNRLYNSPQAKGKMMQQIQVWSDALIKNTEGKAVTADQLAKEMIIFRRTSQTGHIAARIMAGGISMLGLGIIVPKLQYAMTKKLTGKNEHPGLATLHHQDQHTHSWHKHTPEEHYHRTFLDA